MRIEYHRTLIADRLRTQAFHEALKALIVPGESIVADIGAGTGILGFLALRLGAKKVILYECEEVAEVAKKIAKVNKLRGIEIMPCHSTEIADPEQVDIVVSETLGNYALEENIVPTLDDARTRHLKPDGHMIPSRIVQSVAPVVSDRVHRDLIAWRTLAADFALDFGRAERMSLNNIYVRRLLTEELSAPRVWDTLDLMQHEAVRRKGKVEWPITRSTSIYGFALWWAATLVPGVILSTAPGAPETHWEQLYLPLLRPLTLIAGESVAIAIESLSSYDDGTNIAWVVTVAGVDGTRRDRQALDLNKGFLP